MATLNKLIETLKEKNLSQTEELEYVIIKPTGELVTMYVTAKTAKSLIKFLKLMKD